MQLTLAAFLAAATSVAASGAAGDGRAGRLIQDDAAHGQARLGRLGPDVLEEVAEHHHKHGSGTRPNFVFIITDDQDLHMNSLDYLPYVKKHLRDQGTTFRRHFCTTAVCCPSRVSLWTGKQAHNTNVTDVNPPHGGYPKFLSQGLNDNYLPVWLQAAGYDTYYTGKLFNAHTVENYNSPKANGWTQNDFLLDPFTYQYLNASYQRNDEPPRSYEGQYTVDVLADKAYGFLEAAAANRKADGTPFFLGIAPVAPHSNVEIGTALGDIDDILDAKFSAPVSAKRHEHLFADLTVPRTPHFNPEAASGVSWVSRLDRQTQANVDANDHFYRQRLRALQSVDELVDGVFARLDRLGLADNTYVFYTTDNGFHIGQHRLQPGKECGFEEDINIPLIVRGPGIPGGRVSQAVTTHVDLAPTLLKLARAPARVDFDGEPIPLTAHELDVAAVDNGAGRHEHVTVEFWGFAAAEGDFGFNGGSRIVTNNTYKAVRIIGRAYNLYYSVYCSNEHELYNLDTDPYQLHNLLGHVAGHSGGHAPPTHLLDVPLAKVVARLDSLLLVLKSCKGRACVRPWAELHPDGDVRNLREALAPEFDAFYEVEQKRVSYASCEAGYFVDAEGPQFETDGIAYRHGAKWHEWV
ncbi:arylsulfatase [Sporothrix brasiliensis 5110]|uniref:Arylsulfatase n=1 Tax=Sporothrix brasiliensis 5110 TaxID=1398154 RepID=A0A0C2INP8_9PEZI|nr:arylsulfatase [Sporothrix brasiliensis 5110]KIH86657.1 arylsulfatase [Sporothrix brasiliensis 5110]